MEDEEKSLRRMSRIDDQEMRSAENFDIEIVCILSSLVTSSNELRHSKRSVLLVS